MVTTGVAKAVVAAVVLVTAFSDDPDCFPNACPLVGAPPKMDEEVVPPNTEEVVVTTIGLVVAEKADEDDGAAVADGLTTPSSRWASPEVTEGVQPPCALCVFTRFGLESSSLIIGGSLTGSAFFIKRSPSTAMASANLR